MPFMKVISNDSYIFDHFELYAKFSFRATDRRKNLTLKSRFGQILI